MFESLTKYLLQYKRVSLPSVGTIQLLQQPAQLDVAGKVILPPSFIPELRPADAVPEHQLAFLSAQLNEEKETVNQLLEEFGLRLKEKLDGEGFHWNGIGVFHRNDDAQTPIAVTGLEPVVSERIIRHDAEHRVLVGDQQLTSTQIAGLREETVTPNKSSVLLIIAWIILALSILYILFILWQGRFRLHATGAKTSPVAALQKPKAEPKV